MKQKSIRAWNGKQFTSEEGAAWLAELDDRTKSNVEGLNSIGEIAKYLKPTVSAAGSSMISNGSFFLGKAVGCIKISVPSGLRLISFNLKGNVYSYGKGKSFDFMLSGYIYQSGGWAQCSAHIVSSFSADNLKIRFCIQNNLPIITIGELTSSWNKCFVVLERINYKRLGVNNVPVDDGWGVGIESRTFGSEKVVVNNTLV